MPKIIISRPGSLLNRRANFQIKINEQPIGYIKNDGAEEFELEPGIYSIECKYLWCSSNILKVELKDKSVFLKVSNGQKYFWYLYSLLLFAIMVQFGLDWANIIRPNWLKVVQTLCVVIPVLYMLYYITIGRKQFIRLAEDANNLFN